MPETPAFAAMLDGGTMIYRAGSSGQIFHFLALPRIPDPPLPPSLPSYPVPWRKICELLLPSSEVTVIFHGHFDVPFRWLSLSLYKILDRQRFNRLFFFFIQRYRAFFLIRSKRNIFFPTGGKLAVWHAVTEEVTAIEARRVRSRRKIFMQI
jgi:hypothetical protein